MLRDIYCLCFSSWSADFWMEFCSACCLPLLPVAGQCQLIKWPGAGESAQVVSRDVNTAAEHCAFAEKFHRMCCKITFEDLYSLSLTHSCWLPLADFPLEDPAVVFSDGAMVVGGQWCDPE